MSLLDVDKGNDDRGRPSVNKHDELLVGSVMARGTNSTNYTTDVPTPSTNPTGTQLGTLSLVQTNIAAVINDGAPLSTSITPHGLPFTPYMISALNGATLGSYTDVSLNLPTFLSETTSTGAGTVSFSSYLYGFVDDTYVYFQILNATGSPITVDVTYYLYRQLAQH